VHFTFFYEKFYRVSFKDIDKNFTTNAEGFLFKIAHGSLFF